MSGENKEIGTEEQINPISSQRRVAYYYDRTLGIHCINISNDWELFIWEASSHESRVLEAILTFSLNALRSQSLLYRHTN